MLDGIPSEFVAVPEAALVSIPEHHLSFAEATTLPRTADTAWHSLIEVGGVKAATRFSCRHQRRIDLRAAARESARREGDRHVVIR